MYYDSVIPVFYEKTDKNCKKVFRFERAEMTNKRPPSGKESDRLRHLGIECFQLSHYQFSAICSFSFHGDAERINAGSGGSGDGDRSLG